MEEYDDIDMPSSPSIGQKRSYSIFEDDDIDSDEEYEKLRQSLDSQATFNEFDNYIQLPRIERKIKILDWWRQAAEQYPRLARMARDYFAVPATDAGVEREFSKSRRIATAQRSRLSSKTITNIMLYKNYLTRQDKKLTFWKGAEMGMGEDIIVQFSIGANDVVPKEWKDRWWLE